MNTGGRRVSDEQLNAYLDGTMSSGDRAELEKLLAQDADTTQRVDLQRNIDRRLRQIFAAPTASAADIEQLISGADQSEVHAPFPSARMPRRSLLVVAGGLAATLACALFAWQWRGRRSIQPYFQPRPLAEVYRESVESGFRPYYFCEDEDRFRLTFERRQNVPLRLVQMPSDRRMVGLSYLGGLSRNTTAILCYSKSKPVVVFVDRHETDTPTATDDPDPNLHVLRRRLGDLVLYEVTPLESATIMEFLEIISVKP